MPTTIRPTAIRSTTILSTTILSTTLGTVPAPVRGALTTRRATLLLGAVTSRPTVAAVTPMPAAVAMPSTALGAVAKRALPTRLRALTAPGWRIRRRIGRTIERAIVAVRAVGARAIGRRI
ncbi:MAG: hypothetical protein P3B76_07770, partial [Gemmatimonadota bacterium]|nr:hypothetical protein [Gemmatimonadota bacterium]